MLLIDLICVAGVLAIIRHERRQRRARTHQQFRSRVLPFDGDPR